MGKGGGRGQAQKVDELVAKGYSRSKATQALKDAGNNVQVALRSLEREAERRRASEGPKLQPRLAVSRAEAPATAEAAEPVARVRLHPCIVQYGSCRFGESCRLQNLPGDVCINYYNGSCIYGDMCRRRHTVDGVDLREGQRQRPGDILTREDGVRYRLINGERRGVQVAQIVKEDEVEDRDGVLQGVAVSAVPEPSAYALVRGSEPTHTDPLRMEETVAPAAPSRPQPFLDCVREGGPLSSAPTFTVVAPASVEQVPPARAGLRVLVNGRTRHPCIAQLGSCKYGSNCAHADRAADVCVFYLNGRCRLSEQQCKYRHESSEAYAAGLVAAHQPSPPTPASAAGAKRKSRLQSLGGAAALTRAAVVGNGDGSYAQTGACSVSSGGTDVESDSEVEVDGAGAGGGAALGDAELTVFLGLLEAFPQEEPAVVLQALRSSGGDPAAVADLLGRVGGTDPADVDAALARVLAEEEATEEAAERHAREAAAKSESLMTLCFLFPALELTSVEAVFHRSADCFEEAYEVLLCSQENITRRDYGNVWSGSVGPAEQLKVEKLCGMFREVHPDIVRSTFGASEKDFAATVAALNNLVSELLSLRTRTAMGEEAVRWRPHAGAGGGARPARPAVQSAESFPSDAEVHALYREAEDELRELGDWRRVRQRAYMMNTCRLRVLSQASAAFLRGEGALAKALSREGRALGAEYERLNRLAMVALETERLATDAVTTLDLHGFHAEEAKGVLARRVELCHRKRIGRLCIVVGKGHHSRSGVATLYPVVRDFLATDARMRELVQLTSVKPGLLEARLKLC